MKVYELKLSARTRNALWNWGYAQQRFDGADWMCKADIEFFSSVRRHDLLKIRNFGKVCLVELENVLASHGVTTVDGIMTTISVDIRIEALLVVVADSLKKIELLCAAQRKRVK